ncbi:MAG: recombination mediator RecR [Eubacteriales bacterium]|nr:recombination mediator RecR [Clostridiales bacterium]MDD6341664.1 recombination mediator RecR [Eubacteriales bacterium]MDD7394356.1 recombination mediator RecR [Eubacteriales bacterium]MDY3760045.1 recombination mediator RecR [Eubacteriales bacterium]
MSYNVNPLDVLTEQFRKLPGIGKKSAQRIAFHVLRMTDGQAEEFLRAINDARKVIHLCPICQNLTDGDICSICGNEKRDKSVICVVSSPQDVISIEKTNEYRGVYHVLHGVLSPIDHIGPKDLKVSELLERMDGDTVREVIVATAPTVEGDATAIFLANLLKPLGVSVTRLAFGIPVGGDIEYADEITLSRSLENRREM